MRRKNCSSVSCSLSRRNFSSIASVSGVISTLASNGIASSGSHGARSGMTAGMKPWRWAPASSDERPGMIPASGRRFSRKG